MVSQFKALGSKVLLVRAGDHNWVLFQLSGFRVSLSLSPKAS